jgi:hypothetical protein
VYCACVLSDISPLVLEMVVYCACVLWLSIVFTPLVLCWRIVAYCGCVLCWRIAFDRLKFLAYCLLLGTDQPSPKLDRNLTLLGSLFLGRNFWVNASTIQGQKLNTSTVLLVRLRLEYKDRNLTLLLHLASATGVLRLTG